MLYTAFVLGFFGSVHCLAMCGPLVIAFGQSSRSFGLKSLQQVGRILGYSLLGLLIGLVGNSVAIFNVGQKISLLIGLLIIGFTLFSFFKKNISSVFSGSWLVKLQSTALKNTKNVGLRFFILGLINSLLPCGLLFVALGASATMPSVEHSVLYMFFFGLGTLPSMLGVLFFGNQVAHKLQSLQKVLVPSLSLIIGFLMVIRGLGLGIPYLSPKMNLKTKTAECCKHKTEQCEVR